MTDSELIDIVDKNNTVIGTATVNFAHEKKLMHRVVGIFVFDNDEKLYLQKNDKHGKLDISVGGHVKKGELYETAAKREMFEELRLNARIKHISTFLPENARLAHFWSIYTAVAPQEWEFKETEEVKSVEKMKISDVIALVNSSPELFTKGFINTIKELIRVNKYGQ